MCAGIVQTSDFVTLVGAGPVNAGILEDALKAAPYLIGVDGGAQLARNYGKEPEYVLGDFDSLDADFLKTFPRERLISFDEQETTDFDKALRSVRSPLILGVGFLGARIDHQLAVLNSLARSGAPCILLGAEDLVFRVRDHTELALDPGMRLSLYPMTETRIRANGLRWPLGDGLLSPGGLISQSNEVSEPKVKLSADGNVLAILPRQALAAASAALTLSRQTT